MTRRMKVSLALVAVLIVAGAGTVVWYRHGGLRTSMRMGDEYFCPMHPQIVHDSITPRTIHALVRSPLVRGHSTTACSISSPVALNVGLCKEN